MRSFKVACLRALLWLCGWVMGEANRLGLWAHRRLGALGSRP